MLKGWVRQCMRTGFWVLWKRAISIRHIISFTPIIIVLLLKLAQGSSTVRQGDSWISPKPSRLPTFPPNPSSWKWLHFPRIVIPGLCREFEMMSSPAESVDELCSRTCSPLQLRSRCVSFVVQKPTFLPTWAGCLRPTFPAGPVSTWRVDHHSIFPREGVLWLRLASTSILADGKKHIAETWREEKKKAGYMLPTLGLQL